MARDILYALRQLRRSPIFTLTAVLTLGLGLGAAATMWSVMQKVLLSPVPYRDPQRLVGIAFTFPHEQPNPEQIGASADFLAQHSRSFQSTGVAIDGNETVNLSAGAQVRPARVTMRSVSAGYLPTLGVEPMLGRNFTGAEDHSGGPPAVLLSYALWRTAFHADRGIVGQVVHVDEDPVSVVGVLPKTFRDPSAVEEAAVLRPLQLSPSQPGYDGDNYIMVGRLAPGVTLASAQAELSALNGPFYTQYPSFRRWNSDIGGNRKVLHAYRIWPLATALTGDTRGSLLVLGFAVGAVLLLACLNLAGLSSTRATARSQELGIRSALGGSRWDLMRLLITEGVLLACVSGLLAFGAARLVEPAVLAASPLPFPMLGAGSLWRQALFIAMAAASACLLFSMLPALMALRRAPALPGRSTVSLDRAQTRFGGALVVLQAALTMLLLAGASLLLGVFVRLSSTSPGFRPAQLVTAQVALRGSRYDTTSQTSQFVNQVVSRLQATPGIEGVAAIDGFPLDRGLNLGMQPGDHPGGNGVTELRPVTPDYFSVMRLHLLAGRLLHAQDRSGSMRVALISKQTAQDWWPNQNAVGKVVEYMGSDKQPMQVVGIVSDTHTNSLAEPFPDMVYVQYDQLSDGVTKMINGWFSISFVMRAKGQVPIARAIESAVHAADAELPVSRVQTLQSFIEKSTAAPRFFSSVSSSFAFFALLLSGVGLFGLLSYQVAQRTREFGLRMALGATRERILRMILARGLTLVATGTLVGAVGSLWLPRLIASVIPEMLYVGDTPPSALLTGNYLLPLLAAGLLLLAAAASAFAPAWRAAHVEPMEALRAE